MRGGELVERQPRVSRHEWAWCVAFVAAAALLLGVAAKAKELGLPL